MEQAATPERFFASHPLALSIYRSVWAIVQSFGPVCVRTTRSQVAFRRQRGFVYLWLPGRWLSRPAAEVVLSIALGRPLDSPRFKQVVHPSAHIWMHHLELQSLDQLDDEVLGWLRDAYADAA